MRRRVTAVLLAGGRSQRYGSDKAFAKLDGKEFLARVGESVRGVSDAILILAPFGADAARYAGLVPGATVAPDRQAGQGPVAALREAFQLVRTPTVLVAPCDAPGLPAGLARRLVALCEELGRPVVAEPRSGPLHSLFAAPRRHLEESLPNAKRLADLTVGAERVPTDAELLNVNGPGT